VKLDVSEPRATVTVDGHAAGVTPLAPLALDLGEHTVVVRKPGFDPVEQKVQVPGGSEVALSITLAAQRQVAHLVVAAEARATVTVDGKPGVDGRFDGQASPGVHDVQVTEAGKVPYRAQIELHPGEMRRVEVTLEDEKHGSPVWPWIAGGAAVVAGAAVGGYFLFRPQDHQAALVTGDFATAKLSTIGRVP
jgi:hypothetical protein